MEAVLDVYKRPYNPLRPVVCMDESPRQLIQETRTPLPVKAGRAGRYDYEYRRCGVCSIFIAGEPLKGTRLSRCVNNGPSRTGPGFWPLFGRYDEALEIFIASSIGIQINLLR